MPLARSLPSDHDPAIGLDRERPAGEEARCHHAVPAERAVGIAGGGVGFTRRRGGDRDRQRHDETAQLTTLAHAASAERG